MEDVNITAEEEEKLQKAYPWIMEEVGKKYEDLENYNS